MKIENVDNVFFDETAIRLPPYKVGRVTPGGGGRAYVKLVDGELETPFRLYPSLTTSIAQCEQTPEALIEWKMKLGAKEADRQAKVTAHYGTLLHEQIGEFLINKYVDFDELQNVIDTYLSTNNFYDTDVLNWGYSLKADLCCFIQFYNDYNLRTIAIECVLVSDKHGYATPIDWVGYMDIEKEGAWGEVYKSGKQKGKSKITKKKVTLTGIINFKSGRHTFYRNNGIQMEAEKMLWEENFPDIPLDVCMNWSPKDFETAPGYNVKDWSGIISEKEVEQVMLLANIRYGKRMLGKKFIDIKGVYVEGRNLSPNISIIDIETFCRKSFTKAPI